MLLYQLTQAFSGLQANRSAYTSTLCTRLNELGTCRLLNELHGPRRLSFEFKQVLFGLMQALLRYKCDGQTDDFSALYGRCDDHLGYNLCLLYYINS